MGNQFSAELSDGRELALVFLESFGKEYEKLYVLNMVKYVRKRNHYDDASYGKASSRWKLYHAPFLPPQFGVREEVIAAKLSKHFKRWNTRLFILRGDFLIEYYEKREDYAASKPPLGRINMTNFDFSRNAREAIKERNMALAHQWSVAASEVPSPSSIPDNTIELSHSRRHAILLQFPQTDRYKIWCDIFERAHWLAPRLNNPEIVHSKSFSTAYRRARVQCGLRDTVDFGGGETAALEDAIIELIDARVLPKLDTRVEGTWQQKLSVREKFCAKSYELVGSHVCGKWHGVQGRTVAKRGITEGVVREYFGHIDSVASQMCEEIRDHTEDDTRSFLDTRIRPHLTQLAGKLAGTLLEELAKLPKLFEAYVSQGEVAYEPMGDHMFLATHYNGTGGCFDIERAFWDLRPFIDALSEQFNATVFPWYVIEHSVLFYLRCIITNALYTFETLFERYKSHRPWDDTAREVRGLVEADAKSAGPRALGKLLYYTSIFFFIDVYVKGNVSFLKQSMVAPLENSIPQELKQFVNAQELVYDVMCEDLMAMCDEIAVAAFKALKSAKS